MTRVLVVHHDVDVADIEVEALRRAGYEVDQCAGPVGGSLCPVMHGAPCWQVEQADVLVYDMWALPEGHRELIDDLSRVHPDKPVVVTSPGLVLDWVEAEGATPVLGAATGRDLAVAVEAALRRPRHAPAPGAGPATPSW